MSSMPVVRHSRYQAGKPSVRLITDFYFHLVYEQQYVRTMFLEKCEKKTIDGVTYDISNATQVEIWNCKSKIYEIYNYVDASMMEMTLT